MHINFFGQDNCIIRHYDGTISHFNHFNILYFTCQFNIQQCKTQWDATAFRNITLHVTQFSSCGPDDGHDLTETCRPIEFIKTPCNRDLAFVVFDGCIKKADYLTQSYGEH